jgi:hypothetical protein
LTGAALRGGPCHAPGPPEPQAGPALLLAALPRPPAYGYAMLAQAALGGFKGCRGTICLDRLAATEHALNNSAIKHARSQQGPPGPPRPTSPSSSPASSGGSASRRAGRGGATKGCGPSLGHWHAWRLGGQVQLRVRVMTADGQDRQATSSATADRQDRHASSSATPDRLGPHGISCHYRPTGPSERHLWPVSRPSRGVLGNTRLEPYTCTTH